MILLAALAASLFARRFTPQAEWLHQACRRIEATVPGFQGFHIIGGGVRAGNAAPLPGPVSPCHGGAGNAVSR
jgi:hypothetical protein